jgi:hypothetical protein
VLEHCPSGVLTRVGSPGYVLEVTDPVAFTDEVRGRLNALAQEHRDAADQAAEEPRPLSPFEVLKRALETGDFRPLALTPENTPELFGRTFVGGQRIGDDPRRPRRDRRN